MHGNRRSKIHKILTKFSHNNAHSIFGFNLSFFHAHLSHCHIHFRFQRLHRWWQRQRRRCCIGKCAHNFHFQKSKIVFVFALLLLLLCSWLFYVHRALSTEHTCSGKMRIYFYAPTSYFQTHHGDKAIKRCICALHCRHKITKISIKNKSCAYFYFYTH